MATQNDNTTTQVLEQVRHLVEKSVSANTKHLQNGTEILRRASNGKLKLSQLTETGDVVRSALEDYLRLSTDHASRLIDLGIEVSNHILQSIADKGPKPRKVVPSIDIKLSGKPGCECQAVFIVECDRSKAVKANFKAGLFVDQKGENAIDIPVLFEPAEVLIQPGGKERFVLALTIPIEIPPGSYKTLIACETMTDINIRLLLDVEPDTQNKPIRKTATKRKPGKRKTSKKHATKRRPTSSKASRKKKPKI